MSDVSENRSIAQVKSDIEAFLPPRQTYSLDVRPTYLPPHIDTWPFIYERVDHHKPPLSPAYEGPFPVLDRREKTIKVNRNGKISWLSIDRVKPAF